MLLAVSGHFIGGISKQIMNGTGFSQNKRLPEHDWIPKAYAVISLLSQLACENSMFWQPLTVCLSSFTGVISCSQRQGLPHRNFWNPGDPEQSAALRRNAGSELFHGRAGTG